MRYTTKIRELLTTDRPRGIIIDVVEYPQFLALRVYRDNINSFPDHKQQEIYAWLNTTLVYINTITPCRLEAEGTPPDLKGKK